MVGESLKIAISDHFSGVVSALSPLRVIHEIRDKLTRNQRRLFRQTCLGYFLKVGNIQVSGNLVHHVLLHELDRDGSNEEMWFAFGDTHIRFSRQEFCLITGLFFGSYPVYEGGNDRLLHQYFEGRMRFKLREVDHIYAQLDFNQIDDTDAVKLSLYYLVDRCLLARPGHYHADIWLLRIVDDLTAFNQYPWGTIVWRYTYRSVSRIMRGQVALHQKMLATARPNAKPHINRYNVEGFSIAFLVPLN